MSEEDAEQALAATLRGTHLSDGSESSEAESEAHVRQRSASGVLVSSHPITDLSQEVLSDSDEDSCTSLEDTSSQQAPASHSGVSETATAGRGGTGGHRGDRCTLAATAVRDAWASTLVFEGGRVYSTGGLCRSVKVRLVTL